MSSGPRKRLIQKGKIEIYQINQLVFGVVALLGCFQGSMSYCFAIRTVADASCADSGDSGHDRRGIQRSPAAGGRRVRGLTGMFMFVEPTTL